MRSKRSARVKTTKREPLLQGFGYRYLSSLHTIFNDFFFAIFWGSLTSIFSSHNHVSTEKLVYCSAPAGHLTCFQHLVGDSNGLKMQTKLLSPASMQYFCTKISIAKGTHTLIYQALISLIDSKQRRHHNFRGRLITQQLHRTKHRLL